MDFFSQIRLPRALYNSSLLHSESLPHFSTMIFVFALLFVVCRAASIISFCLSRVSSLDNPSSHLTHSCYPEPLICSDHVGSLYFIHSHGHLSSLSVVFNVTYIMLSSRIEGGWKCNSFHQHLSNTRYKSGKLAICTTSRVRRDLGAVM